MERPPEMDEKEKIYRQKSMDQLSTPDDLTGYLRVTGPGVWVVLCGVILVLVGIVIWGMFGSIVSVVKAPAVVEEGKVSCYILANDMADADSTIDIRIGDVELTAERDGAKTVTLNAQDEPDLFSSGYLTPGKKAVVLTCDTDLRDGIYQAEVTTDALKPISLLFANNG